MSGHLTRNAVVAFLGTPDRTEGTLNDPVEREEHEIKFNEKWIYENLTSDPARVPMRIVYWHRYDFMGTMVRANAAEEWRHDTTLAVVAPGIAEALFATAMGLLAAIPAVVFYNKFVNEIARYVGRLESFADEFSAILSRQLDEKAVAA